MGNIFDLVKGALFIIRCFNLYLSCLVVYMFILTKELISMVIRINSAIKIRKIIMNCIIHEFDRRVN